MDSCDDVYRLHTDEEGAREAGGRASPTHLALSVMYDKEEAFKREEATVERGGESRIALSSGVLKPRRKI